MTRQVAAPKATGTKKEIHGPADLGARYGCGPVKFTGTDDALYERRLVFDHVIALEDAGPRGPALLRSARLGPRDRAERRMLRKVVE